jgi:hypothetical protein
MSKIIRKYLDIGPVRSLESLWDLIETKRYFDIQLHAFPLKK